MELNESLFLIKLKRFKTNPNILFVLGFFYTKNFHENV
ncbi:hypothetical protein BD809_107180 [Aquimarina intermedia]|uniref:Uncharacterized protein n=1 Tax=Aquimarina intermedia TaxID=350814 RepID=A0A5S5BYN9_9FLAO|nr:hypothetical protein BD809_107180 [Aquimarina intermedia]